MISQLEAQKSTRPGADGDARERLLAAMPVRERWLQLAGISTAVLEGGDGPPVVLLHGPGEFAATWMRVLPDLVTTYRVLAPDLPGHGASGVGDAPVDVERISAWLGELIERTCVSPPVVVGHLLGGAIALRFAIDNPARVSRLVLVDSYGLAPFRPALRFTLALIGFMVRPNARTQERVFRGCFVDLDGLRHEVGEHWEPLAAYALEQASTPGNKAVLRSLMPKLAMPAIPPAVLARISIPTTLIWGRHDLQVRLRVAEAASARYRWPLHVITRVTTLHTKSPRRSCGRYAPHGPRLRRSARPTPGSAPGSSARGAGRAGRSSLTWPSRPARVSAAATCSSSLIAS